MKRLSLPLIKYVNNNFRKLLKSTVTIERVSIQTCKTDSVRHTYIHKRFIKTMAERIEFTNENVNKTVNQSSINQSINQSVIQ